MQQNISNLPQYNNPNFTAGLPVSNGAAIQDNPLLQQAEKTQQSMLPVVIGTVAAGAGLLGANEYINKGLQGEYSDSFFSKVEKYIDGKCKGPKSTKFNAKMDAIGAWVKKHTYDKSEILRTMIKKPSMGGPMVQSQAAGSMGNLAERALETMREYKTKHPDFTGFDHLVGDKIKKDQASKMIDEIVKAIKKHPETQKELFTKRTWWSLGLLKNGKNLKEVLNKYDLIKGYKTIGKGATLGRKVSGYLFRGAECLTNGLLAGKGAVLFQAFFIGQSLSEASKAEKGEKGKVFMASLLDLMAMMGTIGLQMRVMNGLAGMKFSGWSKAQHSAYQEAMTALNTAAKAGDAATVDAQKTIIKNIKDAVKTSKSPWKQKVARGLGNIFSFGRLNETMKPLKGQFLKKIPYGLKVGAGYVGRAALLMGVIIPIFSGVAKRISYGIFGKPVKTLEKEKNEGKEQAAAQPELTPEQMQQLQQMQQAQQTVQPQTQTAPVQQSKTGDLMNTMNNMNKPQNPQTPMGAQSMTPQNETIPAAATLQDAQKKIKRTYVPNPVLGQEREVKKSDSRSAQIDSLFRQADLAEAQASKYL